MKSVILILGIIGAVLITIGGLPNGDEEGERIGKAMYIGLGAALLAVDAVILGIWWILGKTT